MVPPPSEPIGKRGVPVEQALIVAIDGPAGAGKSSVARRVARALNYLYIDTGAMYRAVALKVLAAGVDLTDEDAVARLARAAAIRLASERDQAKVYLDGQDVTDKIRSPAISGVAAQVAANPGVRGALGSKQRELALRGGTVLEGRDTTSCIVPEAHVKIYLTADPAKRGQRRHAELEARGYASDQAAVSEEIARRDHLDTTRAVAPLVLAPGAHLIDSTDLTLDQVVEQVLGLCRQALGSQS